jgi:hypothetical protein
MSKARKIRFHGKDFEGFQGLVDYWNAGKPDFMHANAQNVRIRLNKFRRENPGEPITDSLLEKLLTTRAAANAIEYKGRYYAGPTALHAAVDVDEKAEFKAFFLNLSRWRKQHPSQELDDAIIESLARAVRVESNDGTRISPARKVWEELETPKTGWAMYATKLAVFRRELNRDPTEDEAIELAWPEEWLVRDEAFTHRDGRQFTRREFYDSFGIEKVAFTTWTQRVNKHKRRKGSITTPEAVDLMKPWGVVDKAKGTLYRWTNRINGKVYIGITTETLEERVRRHLKTVADGDYPPQGLHAAIEEFGLDNFDIDVLGTYEDVEELANEEIRQIEAHECLVPNGYNIDTGGKGVGLRALPLKFRGKKYKNLVALAGDYGIPVKRLESRLRLGWHMAQAVDLPLNMHSQHSLAGQIDRPLSVLAREHGVDPRLVYGRIYRGWSVEEALEIEERKVIPKKRQGIPGGAKPVVIGGQTFISQKEAAKHFGIPAGQWKYRADHGWTPAQIVGVEDPPCNSRIVFVGGETFPNKEAAAKHFGVKVSRWIYLARSGLTPEQIAGLEAAPEKKAAKKLDAKTAIAIYNSTKSRKEIASEFGVHFSVVNSIKQGKSWAQATGAKPAPPRKPTTKR